MTDVLAMIDGALADYETGADAMRWVPPDGRTPAPAATALATLDLRVDAGPFMRAMRRMTEAVSRALPWGELVRKIAPAAQDAHHAEISRMRREYARRQRARRRRR